MEITEAEALYEKVKARLTAAEQKNVAELRAEREQGKDNYYGHDLFAAIRRAEFREKQEQAAAFLNDTCGGNLFAALSRLTRVVLDEYAPTKSGETPEEMLVRALKAELRDVPIEAERARKRREGEGA